MSSEEEYERSIREIVNKLRDDLPAIKGISIATDLATDLYTTFSDDFKEMSIQNFVASATSFQFIAKSLYEYCLSENVDSTYVMVDDYILLLLIVKKIVATAILDRKLAELEGIKKYKELIHDIALKINAIMETTEYAEEDLFASIWRSIPRASLVAIISKEGMPIRVEGENLTLHEAMLGSQIAALANSTEIVMNAPMDFCVIEGNGGDIIVVQLDEKRILTVAIPEKDSANIGSYIVKIKALVEKSFKNSIS